MSDDFSQGKRGAIIRADSNKARITIRLDRDLIEHFKQQVNLRVCAADLYYCERTLTVRFHRSFSLRTNNYAPRMIVKTPTPWHVLATQNSTSQTPNWWRQLSIIN